MKRNCFYTSRIENCDKVGLSLSETISNDKPDEASSRGVNGAMVTTNKDEDSPKVNDTSRNGVLIRFFQRIALSYPVTM